TDGSGRRSWRTRSRSPRPFARTRRAPAGRAPRKTRRSRTRSCPEGLPGSGVRNAFPVVDAPGPVPADEVLEVGARLGESEAAKRRRQRLGEERERNRVGALRPAVERPRCPLAGLRIVGGSPPPPARRGCEA